MFAIDMSALVGIILSHDEQAFLDVREHWPLHAALRELHGSLQADPELSDRWSAAGLPKLRLQPDPEVGMRTSGVTAALWSLAESGGLVLSDDGNGVRFKAGPDYYSQGRRNLMRLDPVVAGAVQRTGQRFAANLAASSKY
jgi:hypothetical protein